MASLSTVRGDITTLAVDAIVNAANTSLLGGGGVDGARALVGGDVVGENAKDLLGEEWMLEGGAVECGAEEVRDGVGAAEEEGA